jgi:hypothetical protein
MIGAVVLFLAAIMVILIGYFDRRHQLGAAARKAAQAAAAKAKSEPTRKRPRNR